MDHDRPYPGEGYPGRDSEGLKVTLFTNQAAVFPDVLSENCRRLGRQLLAGEIITADEWNQALQRCMQTHSQRPEIGSGMLLAALRTVPFSRDVSGRLHGVALTAHQVEVIREGRINDLRMDDLLVLDRLGEGGMGTVYKVWSLPLARLEALKILRTGGDGSKTDHHRFQREAQLLARLVHPGIPTVYSIGFAKFGAYLSLEFVHGTTLAHLVVDRGSVGQMWPAPWVVDKIRQTAEVLHFTHEQGIIHRDVKPENLMILPNGAVKVLDLGIARVMEAAGSAADTNATQRTSLLGTPAVMAPEQWDDPTSVNPATDVYALGCTLYFALTARYPFAGNSMAACAYAHCHEPVPQASRLRLDLPPAMDGILHRMLAKRQADRFPNMAAVIAAFDQLAREQNMALAAGYAPAPEIAPPPPDLPSDSVFTSEGSFETLPPVPGLPPTSTRPAPSRSARPAPPTLAETNDDRRPFRSRTTLADPGPQPAPGRLLLWAGGGLLVLVAGTAALLQSGLLPSSWLPPALRPNQAGLVQADPVDPTPPPNPNPTPDPNPSASATPNQTSVDPITPAGGSGQSRPNTDSTPKPDPTPTAMAASPATESNSGSAAATEPGKLVKPPAAESGTGAKPEPGAALAMVTGNPPVPIKPSVVPPDPATVLQEQAAAALGRGDTLGATAALLKLPKEARPKPETLAAVREHWQSEAHAMRAADDAAREAAALSQLLALEERFAGTAAAGVADWYGRRAQLRSLPFPPKDRVAAISDLRQALRYHGDPKTGKAAGWDGLLALLLVTDPFADDARRKEGAQLANQAAEASQRREWAILVVYALSWAAQAESSRATAVLDHVLSLNLLPEVHQQVQGLRDHFGKRGELADAPLPATLVVSLF